jgi:hypothetical protein
MWIAGLILYASYLTLSMIYALLYLLGVRPSHDQTWMEKLSTYSNANEEYLRDRYKEWIGKLLRSPNPQDSEPVGNHSSAHEVQTPEDVTNQDRGSPRGQSAPVRFGLPCVIAAGGKVSGSPHHPIRWGSASLLLRRRCRRRCRYIWDTSVE